MLDEIDRQIVMLLQAYARLSNSPWPKRLSDDSTVHDGQEFEKRIIKARGIGDAEALGSPLCLHLASCGATSNNYWSQRQ